jgi:PAS domain S-box-containing protein
MLRILHLEDEPLDCELVREWLRRDGLAVEIDCVQTLEDFREALERGNYGLILSDHSVPRVNTNEPLHLARRLRPELPFIFVSGTLGEDVAIETLKLGATDYVLKKRMARLGPAVRRALQEAEEQARRKQAEAALRRGEERFRALVTASSEVLYRMSPDWKEMRQLQSRGFLTKTDAPNRAWFEEYILPGDQAQVKAAIDEAIRSKGVFELEHRVRRADGGVGWTFSRAVPLLGEQGQIVEWFGAAADVTERKRQAAKLEEAYSLLRAVTEGVEEAIFVKDQQSRYLMINTAGARRLGKSSPEAVLHKADGELLPPGEAAAIRTRDREVLASGRSQTYEEIRVLAGTKRVFLTSKAPHRNTEGEIIGVLGISHDITERKKAEELLRENEARLRVFIEHAPAAIAMFDRNMRYLAVSRRWLEDYNLTGRNLLGRSHYEVFPEIPERWKQVHQRCLAGAVVQAEEDLFERADGTHQWLRWEVQPWHSASGQVEGLIIFSEDITQRKQATEALREAHNNLERTVAERTAQLVEANSNLQTFAHTAAHDLRSPLRGISSFSAMFLEDYRTKLDETGRFYLERINQSADQMSRLLNDLLDYSRINEAELTLGVVSLQTAIQEALTLLETEIRSKRAEITVEPALPNVTGHPATVVLIVNNFLSNALKFVASDAFPHIRIWAEKKECGETGDAKKAGMVRLWVEDNGIGIRAEDLPKLFGVFQRLHGKQSYPGTGLGLAIVRRAAERMGGQVGVDSEPGRGSRFWLELAGR